MTTSQTSCPWLRQPPEGLFGRLLDSLADTYVLVLDQDHRVTYANVSFLEHFGLGWENICGRPCDLLGKLFRGTDAIEVGFCPTELSPLYPAKTILTREVEGKAIVYESTIYQLHGAEQAAWTVWSLRDVSDRFRLESQVRQMDDLERNLVQASMDGIIANNMLGDILIFNDGAAKILGYAPEEVIGKLKVYKLYPNNVAHEIKRLIYDPGHGGAGILENYETQVLHKDGTPIPIWLSARLLHEDSREVGIVGYFRDLRERQRLETAVLRNERLATLGRMVARISHEIKNPLVTIGGFAGQLRRTAGLPEDARRKLTLIYQEVQRLEKFLADMSTFSRGAPPQKVMADLPALIREVAELMDDSFKERGVAFRLETRTDIPPISFDPGQIRQVLINLFKNALEAMGDGGELRVQADLRRDHLVLTITDMGHGIPADQLPNLFTPFFTTKEGGTGLGLTIVQGLITQHQGDISIDSEAGRGTTCTIRLPLASA
ncbi:MAG: ATP-binding protein [Syntrophobacterales bacterium]|jgi:PAS domain S-box-containing protein|nr:ATP-binding protein [Syntrophobacterales bacterium]